VKNPLVGLEAKRSWGRQNSAGFPMRLAGW
jgi:hypothetical protein